MGPAEVLDEITGRIVEDEYLAGVAHRVVRSHDADHFGLALVPADVIEERLFPGAEAAGGERRAARVICGGCGGDSSRAWRRGWHGS